MFEGSKLQALFINVSGRLKNPTLTYRLTKETEKRVVFQYIMNQSSKWHATIFIHDGGAFGYRVTYGRIQPNCDVILNEKTCLPWLRTKIETILADPKKELILNGQKYSHCCFCALELTDPRSLDKGYGPICAQKWDLPWGEVVDEEITTFGNGEDFPS